MLVFANGAVKSGSTWLLHIARELTGFGPPPERYANPKWTSQPVYFRSGTVGDWQNHFDAANAADMAALIKRSRHPLRRLALAGPRGVRRLCRPWRSLT
jgi:hypothetical protein